MSNLPKISVNIPLITNGDSSVVLESLKKIDYPKNLIEIIIVEGKHVGKQRNIAIKNSTGEILYLLDDDSKVQKNSFKILAREFSNPNVAAMGGPSLTEKGGTYINELIALTLETYFGAMRMRYRYSNQKGSKGTEYRLVGANLALRKKAVVKVGKFNERIYPCDETELLRRLKKVGYELRYNRRLFIYRNHRRNVQSLIKQFHFYGKGRMKQILLAFSPEDLVFAIPIGFGIYLVSILFYRATWYLMPLALYLILALATSLKASIKHKKPDLLFFMTLTYPIIHLSYAFGLMHEFVIHWRRKKQKKIKKNYITKISVIELT